MCLVLTFFTYLKSDYIRTPQDLFTPNNVCMKLWSSEYKLQQEVEFCSMLCQALREDREEVLKIIFPIIRGMSTPSSCALPLLFVSLGVGLPFLSHGFRAVLPFLRTASLRPVLPQTVLPRHWFYWFNTFGAFCFGWFHF